MLLNDYRLRLALKPEPHRTVTGRMLRAARIPERFWRARVATIPHSADYRAYLERYVKDLHVAERHGHGLLLHGPVGAGKTSAAVAVVKHAIARGCMSPFFLRATEFATAAMLRDSAPKLKSGERLTDAARCSHFLILDDLIVPKTELRGVAVENLIRYRYDHYLPTIVTTNLKVEEINTQLPWLATLLGEVGREVDGREIYSPYDVVPVEEINWRKNPGC